MKGLEGASEVGDGRLVGRVGIFAHERVDERDPPPCLARRGARQRPLNNCASDQNSRRLSYRSETKKRRKNKKHESSKIRRVNSFFLLFCFIPSSVSGSHQLNGTRINYTAAAPLFSLSLTNDGNNRFFICDI